MPVDFGGDDLIDPNTDETLEPGQDLVLVNNSGTEVLRLDADNGSIRMRSADGTVIIRIDASSGNIFLGGPGTDGDLLLYPQSAPNQDTDNATIHLNADGRSVRVGQPEAPGTVRVRGDGEQVDVLGADGTVIASGSLQVRTANGQLRGHISRSGNATLGGGGARGRLELRNADADGTIALNGELGDARLGGAGTDGRLELRQADGTATIVLNGETANVGLGAVDGGNAARLFIKDDSGLDSVVVNGGTAEMRIGRNGNAGLLALRDGDGEESIVMNGAAGNMALGRRDAPGLLNLHDGTLGHSIVLNAAEGNLGLGRFGTPGDLFVADDSGDNTIHLSGNTGNINLSGDVRFTQGVADCAEEFDVLDPGNALPGTVLVIEDHGRLAETDRPYDTRAAGVVSGAGGLRPGVILGADATARPDERCLLAVMGRVFVRADAGFGAIGVGDLLTTSPTSGHAMRVGDPNAARGAVIGKALGRLDRGRGLVEMLVSLQ
ncbi:MAG: hypothetical protein AAGL24_04995 [Pseudomonadota bacterium]